MRKETIGEAELWNGDCMDVMESLPDSSVDAIITDPPYFKVKGEAWDNQWKTAAGFLSWVDGLVVEFERILKPNGSLYFFASPQMAARVEVEIRKRLNILNNITWRKGGAGMRWQGTGHKTRKEDLRAFFPTTEKIIFAEHYNSDNMAKGEAGYHAKCDELRGFVFDPLRAYLKRALDSSGLTVGALNSAMGFVPGGMASHYFSKSQWALPTAEHYAKMRQILGADYLCREYEELRAEYEELRTEYEELRRPFNVTSKDQWGDVWEFDPVQGYKGKHPCEKPLPLLMHMLKASTRPRAVVFDPFTGGGSMGHACHEMGRRFIGVEQCQKNFETALERITAAQSQLRLTND